MVPDWVGWMGMAWVPVPVRLVDGRGVQAGRTSDLGAGRSAIRTAAQPGQMVAEMKARFGHRCKLTLTRGVIPNAMR